MQAQLVLRERRIIGEERFVDMVIWKVSSPVHGSRHSFKYRLAFVVDGVCVLRFDNELGKGDHKHIGAAEIPYVFTTVAQVVSDFWGAIEAWGPV